MMHLDDNLITLQYMGCFEGKRLQMLQCRLHTITYYLSVMLCLSARTTEYAPLLTNRINAHVNT